MKGQKLVLWIMAGAGVILMYSAYHNVSPTSLLAKYMGLSSSTTPLAGGTPSDASKGVNPLSPAAGGGTDSKGRPVDPYGGSGGSTDNPKQYLGRNSVIALSPYSNQYEQVDANGYSAGAIPAGYQVSPGTYVSDGVISV